MKVLVIDRDAELQSLIAFVLERADHASCLATDLSSGLQLLELQHPSLVLLEHHAPQFDGLDICRELRRRTDIPIVILGAQNREDDLVSAVEAGADDYLPKPFSPRVLLARIEALGRRMRDNAPATIQAANVILDLSEQTLQLGESPPVRLTPQETIAIRLLMSTPGKTVTASRLLSQLWGDSSHRTQHMLKQLIYRLRQKVEVNPAAPRFIVTTPSAGYRLVVEADEH